MAEKRIFVYYVYSVVLLKDVCERTAQYIVSVYMQTLKNRTKASIFVYYVHIVAPYLRVGILKFGSPMYKRNSLAVYVNSKIF